MFVYKNISSENFYLMDFHQLYDVPVYTSGGYGREIDYDEYNDMVLVLFENGSKKWIDVRRVLLMLRPSNAIRPRLVDAIFKILTNNKGASGSISRNGNEYSMVYDNKVIEFTINPPDGNVVAKHTTVDGVNLPVHGINYVVAMLIKEGYDIFGLSNSSYAVVTSQDLNIWRNKISYRDEN